MLDLMQISFDEFVMGIKMIVSLFVVPLSIWIVAWAIWRFGAK